MDGKGLDAANSVEEIRQFGSAVLRQAWPHGHLTTLRQAIAAFCDQRRLNIERGAAGASDRMYATHGIGSFRALVGAKLIEPQFLVDMFCESAFHRLCRGYFGGDDFYVVLNRLGFRNHDPMVSDRSFIPYHQDSYTQDERTPHVLNCWITLDPSAGREAPGLEVVRNPCRPDFPRKDFGLKSENAAYDVIAIDRDQIVAAYGEVFMAPEFDLGDALVFSENVIHRTYVTPTMTQARINFEFRVFSSDHLKPGLTIADLGQAAIRIS